MLMSKLRPFYDVPKAEWILCRASQSAGKSPRDGSPDIAQKEGLRQWVIRELIDTYHYPSAWLRERLLVLPCPASLPSLDGIFGFALTTATRQPFFLVSITRRGNAAAAEESLRRAMLESDALGLGLATDGGEKGTVFLRRRFDRAKVEYVPDLETYRQPGHAPGTAPFLFDIGGSGGINTASSLQPLTDRIENLFFELHSHIRDIDGLHADESLDELCKLLYAKLYDEESAKPEAPVRLQRWIYGTTEELAASARGLYHEAGEYDLRVFRLKIPQYERSRGVFVSPIRLSSPALAKVIETLQRFSLTHSDADVKGRAFQRVLTPAIRAGMGQYFTPEPVVRFIVDVVQPRIDELILDPFCGSGHFLSMSLDHVRRSLGNGQAKRFHEFAFGKLHGIEKSDRMVRIAMTDMRLHGDGHSNVRCTDALLHFANYPDLEPESFDVILTNPPFGSLLGKESLAQLGRFELAHGKTKVPLEVLGLERCLQFLRPGGRLAIVLPDSILTNRGTAYVRKWLERQARIRAIVSLPIEAFSPFGANIKTSILFLRKWEAGESRDGDYPLCLVRVDSLGYDTAGRKKAPSELSQAAEQLQRFFTREGW